MYVAVVVAFVLLFLGLLACLIYLGFEICCGPDGLKDFLQRKVRLVFPDTYHRMKIFNDINLGFGRLVGIEVCFQLAYELNLCRVKDLIECFQRSGHVVWYEATPLNGCTELDELHFWFCEFIFKLLAFWWQLRSLATNTLRKEIRSL